MRKEWILPEAVIAGYKSVDVATVSDALDKLSIAGGLLGLKPVVPDTGMCGQAFTVHYLPCGQNRGTVGDFIDDILPGEVAVLDNGGRLDCTVWGDIMAIYASRKGIAGTVIDGVCRDVNVIRELRYPIFSKGTYMVTGKDRVFADRINEPVAICGVQVCPGDLLIGDNSGALVVPRTRAVEVLDVALAIEEKERQIVASIENGMPLREAREKSGYHTLQTPGA